jgi:hypothetical protein
VSGIKHDDGKPRMGLLPTGPLREIAKVMTFGADKYGDHNWRGGFKWSRLTDAALRHLTAWNDGEDKDPESGLSHLAHVACCVLFLLEHEQKKLGNDDRYKVEVRPCQSKVIVTDGKTAQYQLNEESVSTRAANARAP